MDGFITETTPAGYVREVTDGRRHGCLAEVHFYVDQGHRIVGGARIDLGTHGDRLIYIIQVYPVLKMWGQQSGQLSVRNMGGFQRKEKRVRMYIGEKAAGENERISIDADGRFFRLKDMTGLSIPDKKAS